MKQALATAGLLLFAFATSGIPDALGQASTEPAELARLIDRAELALAEGTADASALLSDPKFLPAHAWPRFRQLIKSHAPSTPMTLIVPEEPGKRIRVRVRLVEPDGAPSVGALVYFYHTDQGGDYGPNPADVPPGRDNDSARLFGYAKSNSDGAIEFLTIRPGGYPETTIPEHIHLRIWCPDKRVFGGEIQFADDPRINQAAREEAARFPRIAICPVGTNESGETSVDAEIRLD
jgi:protocatechuate 3,4-dioxygenase beta subunit